MRTLVNLLPECQVVVGTAVELSLERYARHPVEHEIRHLRSELSEPVLTWRESGRTTHPEVDEVRQRPADFLAHSWYCVEHNLASHDEDGVNNPCACVVIKLRRRGGTKSWL